MGVVVKRYIDFLILLIPTPLVSVFFAAASLLFVLFFYVFVLFQYFFVIKFYVLNNFFAQYKHTYGRLRASHGSHIKTAHYTRRSTYKSTLHILRWTSAVLLQGARCRSRSRGRALYRDASRAAYVLDPPPSSVVHGTLTWSGV